MEQQKRVPSLRFKKFSREWGKHLLNKVAKVNPKSSELPNTFIYIDLESVNKGLLLKENRVSKNEAPSRAQRLLNKGDILYQTVRPYQKNNYYFDKDENDYVASTGYAQLRTDNISRFIFQYLHTDTFVNKVLVRCTGTSYPAISSKDLGKIEISLPSLPEQQKIASFLSTVDKKIEQLQQKQNLLEDYKKGVMQQLFSQQLRFTQEDGSDYPDWEEKRLGEVSLSYYQGINTTTEKVNYQKKGFPILQAKHITNERIFFEDARFLSKNDFNRYKEKYSPKKNDILISNIGTLGKVVLIEKDIELLLAWNIFKVEVDEEFINPLYLLYQLRIITKQGYFERVKTGNATKFVNKGDMLKIPLNVPCKQEQIHIANFLSAIDQKITGVQTQIEHTQQFKKGLLQQMFV